MAAEYKPTGKSKHCADGRTVWQSKEFRAFAIRWLGFDPWDPESYPGCRDTVIRMPTDEPISFTIDQLATVESYPIFATDLQTAKEECREKGHIEDDGTHCKRCGVRLDKDTLKEDAEGLWLIQRLSDGLYWSEVGRQDGLSMWVDFPEHGDKYAGKEAAEMKIKEDDWFSFDTCRAVPLKKEMKR